MELFKREHPEAFFKHKTVTDKSTGRKTAVPILDKFGRKIPIAGPTRQLWETIITDDGTIVLPKALYEDVESLVGRLNQYNRERYLEYKAEYEKLPKQVKNTVQQSDYLTSWLGAGSVQETRVIRTDNTIGTEISYKSYQTYDYLKGSIKAMKNRYSLSTAIQIAKQNLEDYLDLEKVKQREQMYRDNFAEFVESILNTTQFTEKIKSFEPKEFRFWFDTVVKPQLNENNLVGTNGSFYMMYDSDSILEPEKFQKIYKIFSQWFS